MTIGFSRINSKIIVGYSRLGRCWKYSYRGFEFRGDQEMQGKSNAEDSAINSERLDLDLVLWKVNPIPLLQCSDVSHADITI